MTRRVMITGAASGLGWALTRQYHQRGWHVILVDCDQQKLSQCEDQLADRCEFYCVDLTDNDQVASELQDIFQRPLDLLINNAGITHRSQASVTDAEVFSRVMAINWFAPVRLTQQCLSALQRSGGGVVCISSMAAKMPVPGRAAYGASKAALAQHFEIWRPELQQRGIDLLIVFPSFLSTSIEENALGSDGQRTLRPRSIVGKIQSADVMAESIVNAQSRGKQRLLTQQRLSRFGAWLWFHTPWLYQRLTWRKFAEELTQG